MGSDHSPRHLSRTTLPVVASIVLAVLWGAFTVFAIYNLLIPGS